jgi:hypothetical protein
MHKISPDALLMVGMLALRLKTKLASQNIQVEVRSLLDPLHTLLLPTTRFKFVDHALHLYAACYFPPVLGTNQMREPEVITSMADEKQYATQLTELQESVTIGFREMMLVELFLKQALADMKTTNRVVFVTDFRQPQQMEYVKRFMPLFVTTLFLDSPTPTNLLTDNIKTSIFYSDLDQMSAVEKLSACRVYDKGVPTPANADVLSQKIESQLDLLIAEALKPSGATPSQNNNQ